MHPSKFENSHASGEYSDIAELTFGLVRILKEKMHKCVGWNSTVNLHRCKTRFNKLYHSRYPGTHSARSFCMLTSFLKQFYSEEDVHSFCDHLVQCRKQTFDLFLSLRANSKNQIFLQTDLVGQLFFIEFFTWNRRLYLIKSFLFDRLCIKTHRTLSISWIKVLRNRVTLKVMNKPCLFHTYHSKMLLFYVLISVGYEAQLYYIW